MVNIKKIPDLQKIKTKKDNKERTFYVPSPLEKQHYIKVKQELEEKYSLSLNNRDTSIKQIVSMLSQGSIEFVPKIDLMIVRTDISNFFPSINKHSLYKNLMKDNYLSLDATETLKEFIFNKSVSGLPQGIPFSSILSEFYLQDFDYDMINKFSPYLYQRYVDDILLINIISKYNPPIEIGQIRDKLQLISNKYDLSINEDKTEIVYFKDERDRGFDFNYLGYRFKTVIEGNKFKLIVSISDDKFNKIWNRIYGLFQSYIMSDRSKADYWKLYYKLINSVHGVTSINDKNEVLKFGLGYSYKYINYPDQLKLLFNRVNYEIFKCDLSSNENYSLQQLTHYNDSPLEVLNKRFNYMKLTRKQLSKMHKRINSPGNRNRLESFFYYLYKD